MSRTTLVLLACLAVTVGAYVVLFGSGPLRLENPARLIATLATGVACVAVALVTLRRAP
jgi:lipopolysaccharide export LptBFGC system permease protein LptF